MANTRALQEIRRKSNRIDRRMDEQAREIKRLQDAVKELNKIIKENK